MSAWRGSLCATKRLSRTDTRGVWSRHNTRAYGTEADQDPIPAWQARRLPGFWSCTHGLRWGPGPGSLRGPGAYGLRGARQLLPSAARASARDPVAAVIVAATRLPPALGAAAARPLLCALHLLTMGVASA